MKNEPLNIPKNTLVHVFFKGGISVEGVVVNWTQEYGVIRAPAGKNNILFYNPAENVLMVKIIHDAPVAEQSVPAPVRTRGRAPTKTAPAPSETSPEKMEPCPSTNLKTRAKTRTEEHLIGIQEQKKMLAKRLREIGRKNVAPQVDRYKAPWENES